MAAPRAASFGRHGIRQRVVLVVLIGTSVLVAALGWLGAVLVSGSRAQLEDERRRLATTVAADVDRHLNEELQELATLALDPDVVHATPDAAAHLRQAYRRSRLLDNLIVIPFDGSTPLVEPTGSALVDRATVDVVRAASAQGRPAIAAAPDGAGVLLLVPMRDETGAAIGAVAGRLPQDHPALQRVLAAAAPVPGGWVEARDANGHMRAYGGARPPSAARNGAVLAATAPVDELGWTVTIAQPDAEALPLAYQLRRAAVVGTPILFAVALLLAWGAAGSVVRPLSQLTISAEAIAAGDLDRPVPEGGADEAGRLARALDDMRVALGQRERDRVRGALLKRTLAVQEDERLRIARELHDETSQTLNALLMGLDAGLARYPSAFTRERLVDARRLAGRLLEGVHRLILALRPSMLDDLGLASAIEWFARQQLEPLGVAVTFEASGTDRRLPREVELALFRAAQEAIANIGRHAGADRALIQYTAEDGHLVLELEDDGRGFDPADAAVIGPSMRGLGLAGMRERIALVGGQLTIDSAPDSGTRILIEAPIAGGSEAQDG
ncbi:MAG: HAMP domain-containing protein [Betaproteobacteria bacterium]